MITRAFTVGLVCALLAGVYFYNRVDQEIRTAAEKWLAAYYPGLDVSVGSARLIERHGFEIRDVTIAEKQTQGKQRSDIAFLDEIFVHCKPTLSGLLEGDVNIRHVTIRRPLIRAIRHMDGFWNVQRLMEVALTARVALPKIRIENGTVEVTDATRVSTELFTIRDVNLMFVGEIAATRESPNSTGLVRYQYEGSLTSDFCQRTTCHGWIDPRCGDWTLDGKTDRFVVAPEMHAALPTEWTAALAWLQRLRMEGSMRFHVSRLMSRMPNLQYQVQADLVGGGWDDPRLKTPISDLRGQLQLDRTGIVIEKMSARFGRSQIELSGRCNSPLHTPTGYLEGQVSRLEVEPELIAMFPESIQAKWRKFQPLGLIDGGFHLAYDGQKWIPNISLKCLDVSVLWEKFPYPLTSVRGQARLKNELLQVDLTAGDPQQPIRMKAEVHNPGSQWSGWFSANTENWLPLDERLKAATTAKTQEIVRAFAASGTVRIDAMYQRPPGATLVREDATVHLNNCTIRHQKFPLPIQGMSGRLIKSNQHWKFENLVGYNDNGIIHAKGSWDPDDRGGVVKLTGSGANIGIDNELRRALSPNIRRQIENLQLEGDIHNVQANFEYLPAARKTHMEVVIQQGPVDQNDAMRSITVNPKAFPYRVENISGTVIYKDGQFWMKKLRGGHGRVRLATQGHGTVAPNGDWSVNFSDIIVDQLHMDDSFMSALSPRFRRSLSQVAMDGRLNLTGTVCLQGTAKNNAAVQSSWDVGINIEDVDFNSGLPLQHVSGAVRLAGETRGAKYFTKGDIDIDSMTYKGIQLTQIIGPLWLDDRRLALGEWAKPAGQEQSTGTMRGRTFGGTFTANGQVSLADAASFDLQLALVDGQFSDVLRELDGVIVDAKGLLSGQLRLQGVQQRQHQLRGDGVIQLREADMYELPVILSLLKTIRSGSTDRSAFNACDVAFHIKGTQAYLDRIDLMGDALAMKGIGEMNFNREIDLNFYTVLGREDSSFPVMRSLLGRASQRFLLIHATGPMAAPELTREVLPGLNETLQSLFPELNSSEGTNSQPAARLSREKSTANGRQSR